MKGRSQFEEAIKNPNEWPALALALAFYYRTWKVRNHGLIPSHTGLCPGVECSLNPTSNFHELSLNFIKSCPGPLTEARAAYLNWNFMKLTNYYFMKFRARNFTSLKIWWTFLAKEFQDTNSITHRCMCRGTSVGNNSPIIHEQFKRRNGPILELFLNYSQDT